jgi:hypothetical protein
MLVDRGGVAASKVFTIHIPYFGKHKNNDARRSRS